jgi:hypothetical protein
MQQLFVITIQKTKNKQVVQLLSELKNWNQVVKTAQW